MGLFGKRRDGRYYQKGVKPITGIKIPKNTELAKSIHRVRDSNLPQSEKNEWEVKYRNWADLEKKFQDRKKLQDIRSQQQRRFG